MHLRKFDLKLSGIAKFGKRKKKKDFGQYHTVTPFKYKEKQICLRTLNLFNALRGAKFASINRVIGIGNTTFVK